MTIEATQPDLPEICPECGNDEVCEGQDYCSDCLEAGEGTLWGVSGTP